MLLNKLLKSYIMAKEKLIWSCHLCGHQQPKWGGQCPGCSEWNSLQEEIIVRDKVRTFSLSTNRPIPLPEVNCDEIPRIATHMSEFDRLMGGGIVPGSLTLVGGEPGIGKSTLLMQICEAIATQGSKVLYVSGEESQMQTSIRAQRLGAKSNNLLIYSETNVVSIRSVIEEIKPILVVIDSIQIVYKPELSSSPGSVTQVRECASEFMHLAKGFNISTFLVGHVTKSGEIAGPRVLEHLVDTVLYFEGDHHNQLRLMRAVKNRFGSTDEIVVFQMKQQGLEEVRSPSELFLSERLKNNPGSVIIPTVEGSRPILIEVQALVSQTVFPSPSRRSTGVDQNRLALLLAVLEKRLNYPLYQKDVFVSVAGGLKISEPSIDLGVLLAIASSLTNRAIHPDVVVVGEVGLGGEVRSVTQIEARLKEAILLGFACCLMPRKNCQGLPESITSKIRIKGIDFVEEAIDVLLP